MSAANLIVRGLAVVVGMGIAVGCGGGGEAEVISPEAKAQAAEIFSTRCFTCHGTAGAGDGPASAGLNPQPRNLQASEWQASVTDKHIEQIIVGGGAAVGMSPAMPGNPDLAGKPEVVKALRAYVRGLENK